MLAKSARLSVAQFDQYFKTGKRFHFTHCTIIYSPLHKLHGSVVVGKKVSKKAVTRNKIRRRVYAQLRTVCDAQSATGVFIIIIKPAYISLSRQAALLDINQHIAEVIKKT